MAPKVGVLTPIELEHLINLDAGVAVPSVGSTRRRTPPTRGIKMVPTPIRSKEHVHPVGCGQHHRFDADSAGFRELCPARYERGGRGSSDWIGAQTCRWMLCISDWFEKVRLVGAFREKVHLVGKCSYE